jgi:hypothetical protein
MLRRFINWLLGRKYARFRTMDGVVLELWVSPLLGEDLGLVWTDGDWVFTNYNGWPHDSCGFPLLGELIQ